MTDSQYMSRAIDFIVEREKDNDFICEELHKHPEEQKMCVEDCQNLDRICVLRFLKHYKQLEQ